MTRSPDFCRDGGRDRLPDRETLTTPRRLSREEHRFLAGPDWSRTRAEPEEEEDADV